MRLTHRAGLLAAALFLVHAPAAAAATLTVDPSGSGGAYTTISAAVAAAAPGDIIAVGKGDYAEDVTIPASLQGLALTGVDGARVLGAPGSPEDVVTVRAENVKLTTLTVDVPGPAGSGVRVDPGATAALNGVAVARSAASSSGQPLVDVAGGATIVGSFVLQQAGAAATPALSAGGPGGVKLTGTTVFSQVGPALAVTEGSANALTRSTAATSAPSSDAIQVFAASASGRALEVDSSFVIGGAQAAGIRVATQGAPGSDVTTLTVRHSTLFGAGRGLVLDAVQPRTLGLPVGPAGSIVAGVAASIVHAPSSAAADAGNAVFPGSTITAGFADSDSPGIAAADRDERTTYSESGLRHTADPAKLFGRDLHLRADAPVIDAGPAQPVAEASKLDIDGQRRPIGSATDFGADEFLNAAPTAALAASVANPVQNEVVTFTATATDPNVGDRVTTYFWDFGDGTGTQTTVPSVSHAFADVGARTVKLAVVDGRGLPSDIAEVALEVRDGLPPVVAITSPAKDQVLKLNRRGRAPRRLVVRGTDRDVSGVRSVQVSLLRRGGKCRHYTGRSFAKRGCNKRSWKTAKLVGDTFKLVTRKGLKLRAGRYELRVRGTDVNGFTSTTFRAKDGSLVRFRVR